MKSKTSISVYHEELLRDILELEEDHASMTDSLQIINNKTHIIINTVNNASNGEDGEYDNEEEEEEEEEEEAEEDDEEDSED